MIRFPRSSHLAGAGMRGEQLPAERGRDEAPVLPPLPLMRRAFQTDDEGRLRVDMASLSPEELRALNEWAELAREQALLTPELAINHPKLFADALVDGRWSILGRETPERLFLDLLATPTGPGDARGAAALRALDKLRMFSSFWGKALEVLREQFAQADPPARKAHLIYNGHATTAMLSLLPTLRALGMDQTTLVCSSRSGSPEARELMILQEPTGFIFPAHEMTSRVHLGEEKHDVGRSGWRSRGLFANATFELETVLSSIVDVPAEKRAKHPELRADPLRSYVDDTLIVDKGGPWLRSLRDPLPKDVLEGRVRFIVHNRDDLEALGPRREKVWGVDLANSLIKKLEARFLGEEYALLGAREAREQFTLRIGDLPVFVVGFGLLGEQIARGLSRLGMPRDRITVVDTDREVLARARRLGFATREGVPADRPENAVVYIATPDKGLDALNVHDFAERVVALSVTSGGKGFDRKSLAKQTVAKKQARKHRTTSKQAVADEELTLKSPTGRATRVLLLDNPNLSYDMWPERFQVTSIGVSAAAQQAWRMDEPGIVRLDRRLDLRLVRESLRNGLWKPQPLEARPGDDPELLARDLQAFTPTP